MKRLAGTILLSAAVLCADDLNREFTTSSMNVILTATAPPVGAGIPLLPTPPIWNLSISLSTTDPAVVGYMVHMEVMMVDGRIQNIDRSIWRSKEERTFKVWALTGTPLKYTALSIARTYAEPASTIPVD